MASKLVQTNTILSKKNLTICLGCLEGDHSSRRGPSFFKFGSELHCGSLQSTGKHFGTVQPKRGKQAVEVVKDLGTKGLLTYWLTTNRLIGWLTDWRTERLTGGLTDWRTYWLTDRLTDWLTDWRTDGLTDWRTDGLTDWRTDGLTDWLTDWQTDGPTYWLTDWLINGWLI